MGDGGGGKQLIASDLHFPTFPLATCETEGPESREEAEAAEEKVLEVWRREEEW